MAEPKTKPTNVNVEGWLASQPAPRDAEGAEMLRLFQRVTGEKAVMWGPSIVGFGTYRYTYASGQGGDWPLMAFSPRKAAMVVYLMPGVKKYAAQLKKLGRHTHGGSCLYLPKMEQVDRRVLEQLVVQAFADMKKVAATYSAQAAVAGRSRPEGSRAKASAKPKPAAKKKVAAKKKAAAKPAGKKAAKKRA